MDEKLPIRAKTVMAPAFKPAWNARTAEAEVTAWLWRESYGRIDRKVRRGSNRDVGDSVSPIRGPPSILDALHEE
jgi:hypothetical protein